MRRGLEFMEGQVRDAKASVSRSELNTDYLKGVVLQLLHFENAPAKRKELVPVLATLLHFTAEDMRALKEATESPGLWGTLAAFGGIGSSQPKRIQLPPTVPVGVEVGEHPSPFVPATPASATPAAAAAASTPLYPQPSPSSSPSRSATASGSGVPPRASAGSVDLTGAVDVSLQ
jgi:hypothetical protein